MPKTKLTEDQKKYIDKHWKSMTYRGIAEHLSIANYRVGDYARRMNYNKAKLKGFSAQEDQFIRDNYLTTPIKTIARAMGRSSYGVRYRIQALRLKVPTKILAQWRQKSRFAKGHIPENKGKKQADYMTPEAIARSAKSRFKKGGLPPNTKHDGAISIRESSEGILYKFIRVSKAKWQLLSRYTWEQHHGTKLKTNEVITFRDGDTLNCDINNLEKITRRQHLHRNRHNCQKQIDKEQARQAIKTQIRNIKKLQNQKL